MKTIIKISVWSITGLLILTVGAARSQDSTLTLSLRNVVDLAITQSSSIKYVQNQNVNYYWRWKNFQTRFRPQLTLTGELPDYTHSTTPVIQPDGNIEFKQVSNAQASAQIALSQSIPLTGTYVYAASSIYRVQDFNNDYTDFSGSPFLIGFYQPLFAYNWMKWSKKTEPIIYERAQKEFIEGIENISYIATYRFFRYLKVQTNYYLAQSNLKNSEDNMRIAETRQELGQISENDFSRIKLSVYNAQKALNKSRMDLKNADFELKSYIGLSQDQEIDLIIPLNMSLFEIDPIKALEEQKTKRKETLEYTRRPIEADRELIAAKRASGPSVILSGSYGVSNSADWFGGVYENTEKQRLLRLSLSIPILDWGRSESQVKLAESG